MWTRKPLLASLIGARTDASDSFVLASTASIWAWLTSRLRRQVLWVFALSYWERPSWVAA